MENEEIGLIGLMILILLLLIGMFCFQSIIEKETAPDKWDKCNELEGYKQIYCYEQYDMTIEETENRDLYIQNKTTTWIPYFIFTFFFWCIVFGAVLIIIKYY